MKVGSRLRVLHTAAECLAPGEVLMVRERSDGQGMYVHCDAGKHYLVTSADGTLRDFELLPDRLTTLDPVTGPDLPEHDATGVGGQAEPTFGGGYYTEEVMKGKDIPMENWEV